MITRSHDKENHVTWSSRDKLSDHVLSHPPADQLSVVSLSPGETLGNQGRLSGGHVLGMLSVTATFRG